jgi:homoserine kinase
LTARRRLVRVPASSANLGPGYDVMAAALDLYLELEVEETGEYSFDPAGLDVPTGRDNLIVRAFETLHSADGIAFRLRSEIPLARGLGSSAAAIVAGLVAADHLFELALGEEELLARAAEIEGHPDNVAAAIHGGFVICSQGSDSGKDGSGAAGGQAAARFDPPSGLEGVVAVPVEEVSTERARAAIPAELPLADAVANISAAARLVLGLQRADLDLVAAGLADRIHQERRRDLYPRSMELVDAAAELGALGATISGAGPTVLVWTTWQDAGKVTAELERRCAGWAEVRRIPFTPHGADVPEL